MTSHFPAHRRADYGSVFFKCLTLPFTIVAFLKTLAGEKLENHKQMQTTEYFVCWRPKAEMSFLVLDHFTWHHVIGAIDCLWRKKERRRLLCKVLKYFHLSSNNEGKYSNSTRNRINKLFSISRQRSLPAAFEKLQIVRQSTGKYPPEYPWLQFNCRAILKVYK